MSSIFLSHNHADKPFVRRLAEDLEAAGIRVWIDEAEIMIGDSLIEKIRQGIDEMEYVGVILSPNSVNSPWVQREVDIAMNQEIKGKRVKVLPLMIAECELPGFLEGKLYADFCDPERYEEEFSKVLSRLQLSSKTEPVSVRDFAKTLLYPHPEPRRVFETFRSMICGALTAARSKIERNEGTPFTSSDFAKLVHRLVNNQEGIRQWGITSDAMELALKSLIQDGTVVESIDTSGEHVYDFRNPHEIIIRHDLHF